MAAQDAVLRTVSPRLVRVVAVVVCAAGIVGMIASSIADNNGAAITFGLIAAVAALVLIVVSAVQPVNSGSSVDEAQAEALEARIGRLVDAGADEQDVRDLVRSAMRLRRRSR